MIGNLSRDVVEGRPARVGGGPFHSGRALRLLGRPAVIAARCATADRHVLLPPVLALGVPVRWHGGGSTATFSISYSGESPRMVVESLGDPWTPDDARGWVAAAVGRAEWIHVAPLSRSDFPAETLAALARGRRLSLDGQGLVRPAREGPLELDADFDREVLRHVTILKLSEEEARVVLPDLGEESLRTLGVPEVVVTLGSRGSIVHTRGRSERIPTRMVQTADPTGAGDAFAVSYMSGRAAGYSPAAAARRAGALVGGLLARQIQ